MSKDFSKRVEIVTAVVVLLMILGGLRFVESKKIYQFDEKTGVLTVDGKIDAHFFDKYYLNSEVKKQELCDA